MVKPVLCPYPLCLCAHVPLLSLIIHLLLLYFSLLSKKEMFYWLWSFESIRVYISWHRVAATKAFFNRIVPKIASIYKERTHHLLVLRTGYPTLQNKLVLSCPCHIAQGCSIFLAHESIVHCTRVQQLAVFICCAQHSLISFAVTKVQTLN